MPGSITKHSTGIKMPKMTSNMIWALVAELPNWRRQNPRLVPLGFSRTT